MKILMIIITNQETLQEQVLLRYADANFLLSASESETAAMKLQLFLETLFLLLVITQ